MGVISIDWKRDSKMITPVVLRRRWGWSEGEVRVKWGWIEGIGERERDWETVKQTTKHIHNTQHTITQQTTTQQHNNTTTQQHNNTTTQQYTQHTY
jgi:hypothetical protein